MEDHNCEDCRFWKPFGVKGVGECHCKAPLPYIHEPKEETLHKVSRWPLTKQHQYCGEFQNREQD